MKYVLKLISKSISNKGWEYNEAPDLAANAALARRIATEGMVLLKNDRSFLPISQGAKIALFGATAYKSIAGGTGSSNVNKASYHRYIYRTRKGRLYTKQQIERTLYKIRGISE